VKRPTDLRGICAIILAAGVMISLVAAAVAASIRGHEFSPDETTLLSTVLGAAIGAVATYLGGGRRPPPED
jgi:hypothetical protein